MRRGSTKIAIRKKRSASRPAFHAHLLLDRQTKVLNEVKSISSLRRLRRTLSDGLGEQSASVAAYNLDGRLSPQPTSRTLDAAVFKNVHDGASFEIDEDCSITRVPSPTPIVDTNYPRRGRRRFSPRLSTRRIVSLLIGMPRQCMIRSLGRPPAL